MSKLARVKAYIEAGNRNKEICELLDVASGYVSTVRTRMSAGSYDEDKEADPKVADGEYFAHYEKIKREKEARAALNRYCVKMVVVNRKAMECGKPSNGRPYCAECREATIKNSRRFVDAGTVIKVKEDV